MNAKIGHRTVRKGDAGPDVKLLQEKLIQSGHSWHRGHRLKPDGHFGQDTDALLRQFQAARGLIADGIAGPKTWMVLNGRPTQGLPVCTWASWTYNGLSCDPVHFTTSQNGIAFIFGLETQPNVSNVLHWPGGGSGVTLGPGYDMGGRTPDEIRADLQAIGISREIADKVSKAAGLRAEEARQFVKDNAKLVTLDPNPKSGHELALLKRVLPHYERIVRESIHIHLYQHEFDALVSFAYNPGKVWGRVAGHLNDGEVAKAMEVIRGLTTSGGKEMPGLVKRRPREVALYLKGDYGPLPKIA